MLKFIIEEAKNILEKDPAAKVCLKLFLLS